MFFLENYGLESRVRLFLIYTMLVFKREQNTKRTLVILSIFKTLLKGFSVFYLLLLPILYATARLAAEQMGYVGAVLMAGTLVGALAVGYYLHVHHKARLLQGALFLLLCATLCLFWVENIWLLSFSYFLIGVATGIGISTNQCIGNTADHPRREVQSICTNCHAQ